VRPAAEERPWRPEEDQEIFDFIEKYGSHGEEPPVPKMAQEDPPMPDWYREELETKERKEMEANILTAFYSVITDLKGPEEAARIAEESRVNKEKVEQEEKEKREEKEESGKRGKDNPDEHW